MIARPRFLLASRVVKVSSAALAIFLAIGPASVARAEPKPPNSDPPIGAATTQTAEPATSAPVAPSGKPPPLHVEYAQYGVSLLALVTLDAGAMCGQRTQPAPCILGSGGGVTIRGGYRSPGPWYIGGAYAFAKVDSANLLRLGILQQLWAEMRYLPDTGYRAAPYATWGAGALTYGNEWGVETGGAMLFAGLGLQLEVSRVAVIGVGLTYKPAVIAGWTDSGGYTRPTGVAQFLGLDFQLEVRQETGRR